MKDDNDNLTKKQESALVALLNTSTVRDAAATCGVSETTLWRWMQVPEFKRRYREARNSVVESALAQVQSSCTIAVTTLREIAEDKKAPATARIAAARTILDQSVRGVARIEAAEQQGQHEHLCATCNNRFMCGQPDCADFEFGRCPDCRRVERETKSVSRPS